MKEIAIKELRRKLELAQKEKDNFQLTVDKLENASKGLNKLINYHIVDNCKKGLGYGNYNVVPPPYTGNLMPPKLDFSFTRLDEFANKLVIENEDMDSDSAHMMAASKVPMLKPGEFEIWRMRIKQYIQMIDNALWKVIENGPTLLKTQVVEGVTTMMLITSVEDKAQRRLEVYKPEVKGMSSSSTSIQNMAFVSSSNNNNTNGAVNTAIGVSTAGTQVNTVNIDNLSDAVICAFLAGQPSSPQLVNE
nr:ribonuclease H-like domain-containing protein [Tanacetum cinerariifolium]